MLHDPAKLVLTGVVERTSEGLHFTGSGRAVRGSSQGPKRDGAVRMTTTFGGSYARLHARRTDSGDAYQLNAAADGKTIVLFRWIAGTKSTVLRTFPMRKPFQPGQDYELELRVVGQTLTAKVDGEVLGTVADRTFPEGVFGVVFSDRNVTPVLVKALEVLDLDAPNGASAAPAAKP